MRTAGCLDGDGRQAVGASFGRRCGRNFFFLSQFVDAADQEKDHQGNDQKTDNGIDKDAVSDDHCARS